MQAMEVNRETVNTGRLRVEDLMWVLRKDPKKKARCEELLFMNAELQRARKIFDVNDEVGGIEGGLAAEEMLNQ